MRKLLLVAVVLQTLFVNAQVEAGIKIGVNSNTIALDGLSSSLSPNVSSLTGYNLGANANINIMNNLNFRPSLTYVNKGFDMDISTSFDIVGIDIPIGAKATTKMNMINAAVPLSYTFVKSNYVDVYGYAGPYLGYILNANMQTKASILFDVNVKKFDLPLDGNSNRLEVGGLVGAGAALKTPNGKLFGELEYAGSFNETIKTPLLDIGMKNKGISFNVGYSFNF